MFKHPTSGVSQSQLSAVVPPPAEHASGHGDGEAPLSSRGDPNHRDGGQGPEGMGGTGTGVPPPQAQLAPGVQTPGVDLPVCGRIAKSQTEIRVFSFFFFYKIINFTAPLVRATECWLPQDT